MMDAWHFEYFRVVCAKEISLYLGTGLWETLVLRAALTERCLLLGVLALGALSRNFLPSGVYGRLALVPGFPADYSLRQYTLAIRELNSRLAASPDSWELAVQGSMIFIAIESLQGNRSVAQMHLRGSLAVLRKYGGLGAGSSQSTADMAHVLDALSRLEGHSSNLTEHRILAILQFPTLPPYFASISQARDSLNSINGTLNSLFGQGTIINQTPPQLPLSSGLVQGIATFTRLLESWLTLFKKFIEDHSVDNKTASCTKILLIQHQVSKISASTYAYSDQSAYDLYISDFSHIVELATDILAAEYVDRAATSRSYPGLPFDMAVVQPLFFVACKCRDHAVRTRAIEAMNQMRGESFYDTQLLARVAKCVVDMEEQPLSRVGTSPAVIPEEDRIQDLNLDFGGANKTCQIIARKRQSSGAWGEVEASLSLGSVSQC
ncbi:hypothetical protein G7046_g4359 [Stylonectria norvegica]|nr:hypothetical protein G7046_g4359 [Stylonectria norvegica]